MTIAEKLTTVAENVEKVYEAGFKKGSESAAGADTREIYQGTRPIEWLRMPDYDKLDENSLYLLLDILPYGDNTLGFMWSFANDVTIEYGTTKDGVFVADEELAKDIIVGAGKGQWAPEYNKTFNYADYAKYQLSNGRRQILIRVKFDVPYGIRLNTMGKNAHIREALCNCDLSTEYFEYGNNGTLNCEYHYITKAMPNTVFPNHLPGKYIKSENGTFKGTPTYGYSRNIVKIFDTWKDTRYAETFRNCLSLEELKIDISEVNYWVNPFRGSCESLRRLIFVGGENLTSFPGDINLNPSSLNVDAVEEFFNTLPTITGSGTGRTITLTNSPAATAGIPEDVLSIATTKGWTVTT